MESNNCDTQRGVVSCGNLAGENHLARGMLPGHTAQGMNKPRYSQDTPGETPGGVRASSREGPSYKMCDCLPQLLTRAPDHLLRSPGLLTPLEGPYAAAAHGCDTAAWESLPGWFVCVQRELPSHGALLASSPPWPPRAPLS